MGSPVPPPDLVRYISMDEFLGKGETEPPLLRKDLIASINGAGGSTKTVLSCRNEVVDKEPRAMRQAAYLRIIMTSHIQGFKEDGKKFQLRKNQIVMAETVFCHLLDDDFPKNLTVYDSTVYIEPDKTSEKWENPFEYDSPAHKTHVMGGKVAQVKLNSSRDYNERIVLHFREEGFYKVTRRDYGFADVYVVSFVDSLHERNHVEVKSFTEFSLLRANLNKNFFFTRFVFDSYMGAMSKAAIAVKRNKNTTDIDKVLLWDAADCLDDENKIASLHRIYHLFCSRLVELLFQSPDPIAKSGKILQICTNNRTIYLREKEDEYGMAHIIVSLGIHIHNETKLATPVCDGNVTYSNSTGKIPSLMWGTRLIVIADTYQQVLSILDTFRSSYDVTLLMTRASEEDMKKYRRISGVTRVQLVEDAAALLATLRKMTFEKDRIQLPNDIGKPVILYSKEYTARSLRPLKLVNVVEADPANWTIDDYCPSVLIIASDLEDLVEVLNGYNSSGTETKNTRLHIFLESSEAETDDGWCQISYHVFKTVGACHARYKTIKHIDSLKDFLKIGREVSKLGYTPGTRIQATLCPTVISSLSYCNDIPLIDMSSAVCMQVFENGTWYCIGSSPLLVLIAQSTDDLADILQKYSSSTRLNSECPIKILINQDVDTEMHNNIMRKSKQIFGVSQVELFSYTKESNGINYCIENISLEDNCSSIKPHPSHNAILAKYLRSFGIKLLELPRHTWLVLGDCQTVPSRLALNNTDISRLGNLENDIFREMRIEPEMMLLIGNNEEKTTLERVMEEGKVEKREFEFFDATTAEWNSEQKYQLLVQKGFVVENV